MAPFSRIERRLGEVQEMDRSTNLDGNPAGSSLSSRLGLSIRGKLLLGMLVVGLVPLFAMGLAAYFSAERADLAKSLTLLEAARTNAAHRLQDYVRALHDLVATFADNRMTADAMRDLRESFRTVLSENEVTAEELDRLRKQLGDFYAGEFNDEDRRRNGNRPSDVPSWLESLDDESVYLQFQYLRNNPNPRDRRDLLDRAGDRSAYSDRHAKYHPVIRGFLRRFGLSDVVLADLETGDVVYSCSKQLSFTTSLKDGPLATSALGRAFATAAAQSDDRVTMLDFERSVLVHEGAVIYLAAPIFDDERKVGVVLVQVPAEQIAALFRDHTGLGRTGETFVVGRDHRFRSELRFADDLPGIKTGGRTAVVLNPKLTFEPTSWSSESPGTGELTDYRGQRVFAAWQPVTVHAATDGDKDLNWIVYSKMDADEVREPMRKMLMAMLSIATLATLSVILAGYALSRTFTRQTDAITGMLAQIGIGNFAARADVLTDDELGQVAVSLNAMCDNTLSLIQTRDERDQIQSAVQQLKEEVAIIANGDLTREAEVSDDLTGGIAESINHMIHQLRTIIGNIHEAASQVTRSAGEIQETTDRVRAGAELQSTQILRTTADIQQMSVSIQQVSAHTEESAKVAGKARENAKQGTLAVRNTIQGMDRIRDQVQETSKRIKRLGETSQEVGEIVQLIGDLADRTSILALNASIQAAMAGEAGKGFAVVAEEVERLAERANQATKQIESLINSIQSETAGAISSMEDCTREVVEGSQLASQAGHALDEIDQVSKELADLILSMTEAARDQARGASAISQAMTDISDVTRETVADTRMAAESAGNLSSLADALQESVAAFRLPQTRPRSELVFDEGVEVVSNSPMGSLILKALK
jgi:methyl-accepting chemotaxis protein/regulator of replication initiation timing